MKCLNILQVRLLFTMYLHSVSEVISKFSPIFEEKVGCVPNFKVPLQLRNGAKPIFIRERDVPYALREQVEKELDTLEAEGIISKVTTSDWGSLLVLIPNPNGGIRLCVDYKYGVNDKLVQANHPLRRIDDALNSLRNSKYFCKLDLFKTYLHLQVDEDVARFKPFQQREEELMDLLGNSQNAELLHNALHKTLKASTEPSSSRLRARGRGFRKRKT